jgi:HlyD family type I secretion membrane fusion protein
MSLLSSAIKKNPFAGANQTDDETLPVDEMPVIRIGLILLGSALAVGIIWGALAPLARGVVAPGIVVAESNRKLIQHLEGGIVNEILVRDGDIVREGQVLARLDDVTSQAQRDVLLASYLGFRGQEARLIAERDGKAKIVFPQELMGDDANGRKVSMRKVEQEIFASRQEALKGQLAIYEQREKQLEQQIKGLRAQVEANSEQIRLIDGELEGLTQLFEKGYASKTRLLELERRRAELDGDRGNFEAEISRAQVAIGEAKLQAIQLRRNFEEEVAQKLQDAQQKIFDLQDRLTSATDVLQRRDVKAPSDGVIMASRIHTIGGVIRPGEPLMELVPSKDRLIIEAQVQPQDIDVVTIGLESEVRFSSLSARSIPILSGQVIKVSADAVADQNGHPYFIARVEVPEDQLANLDGQKIVPGMPAEVLIKSGERTFLQYLMKPLTDSFFHAFKE